MSNIPDVVISDYNYELPDERIAKYPLEERDGAKLLHYGQDGKITTDTFRNLPNLLDNQDLLVFNNARVIHARLFFVKPSGAHIEILCLNPYEPHDYLMSFGQYGTCTWKCMVGNLKKWKSGDPLRICIGEDRYFEATLLEKLDNEQIVRFDWPGDLTFAEILEQLGQIPIPPYLNRDTEQIDEERYQTVYSKCMGSVAAPTAGLHFTDRVLKEIDQRGIARTEVTLHVGAGTFRPVKSENVANHQMHNEVFSVTLSSLKSILSHLGHVTAVGTTSLRTIESLYWLGVQTISNGGSLPKDMFVRQWEPYQYSGRDISPQEAVSALISAMEQSDLKSFNASTNILCMPGYKYRLTDKIITNFHQPKSTLLLLIAAFVGEDWKRLYRFALDNGFRFLSYGDCNLLFRQRT